MFLYLVFSLLLKVFILVSSVYWIEGFVSERPGHEIAKPPRILAPLEALLRDKKSRKNINPLSARSILDLLQPDLMKLEILQDILLIF